MALAMKSICFFPSISHQNSLSPISMRSRVVSASLSSTASLCAEPVGGISEVFSTLKKQGKVIPQISCPVGLFSYYNPIQKCGIEKFMFIVKDAGIHGLLVPDIPLEETGVLRKEAAKNKIDFVLLTSPNTPKHRMKAIVEASAGYVYLATTKPVVVGFGISKPEHVKQYSEWGADGVVVGSAIVKQLGEAKSPNEGLKKLEIFTKSLKSALS